MILGLPRGQVSLAAHQPGWGAVFAQEKERLSWILGGAARLIEHVGSTAVPELAAKPIIDVAIAVDSLAATWAWPGQLVGLDYTSFGDREGWGEHFFAKGPDQNRTIYLHVVPLESPRWADYLKFRDALRLSPALRQEYEALKRQLLLQFGQDRAAYTAAKGALVRRILGGGG